MARDARIEDIIRSEGREKRLFHLRRIFGKYSPGLILCLIASLAYTILFFYLQLRLYRGLHMSTRDLGLFNQAMYNSLHGRFIEISLRFPEGGSLFAEHFYLIMVLVLPIYALFPTPYTLFFLQALAGGTGAIVIFLLAKHYLRNELAATSFALAYLLHPSLQGANLNRFQWGFHPDNFFPPLLLYSLYSLEKGRHYLAASFWVLALAVKEDYAILLVALGLYLLMVKRERRFGAMVITLSILWFIIATGVIIPHFLGETGPWYFLAMGDSKPYEGGLVAFAPAFIWYVIFLLGPLLFLPLADLPSLSVIMPMLLVYLVAFAKGYSTPSDPASWQANAVLPIAFLSAILGLRRLMTLFQEPLKQRRLITLGPILVLLTAAFSTYWLGPLPFSHNIHPLRYAVDEEVAQSVKEVRTLIPQEASLAASPFIGSNFTQQRTILLLQTTSGRFATVDRAMWRRADYVLIDLNPHLRNLPVLSDKFDRKLLRWLKKDREYEVFYSKNNIWLFRKVSSTF